jgi:hypothetical protein
MILEIDANIWIHSFLKEQRIVYIVYCKFIRPNKNL